MKALADYKINVAQKLKLVDGRVENIMGKRENAGYQHFLLSPQCFQKSFILGVIKHWDCVVKGLTETTQLDQKLLVCAYGVLKLLVYAVEIVKLVIIFMKTEMDFKSNGFEKV